MSKIKDIVNTCRICRTWQGPPLKSSTTTRFARDFNGIVQWDLLFVLRYVISHLLDEAIRWTVAAPMADKTPTSIIESISANWLQQYGPMRVLIADGESGLASEEAAQWLSRLFIDLKTKTPGEHAQMVERHHELLRRTILKIEDQCTAEGLTVPFPVIVAEAVLAKNTLVKVAGHTPYRALYGREPPGLADFEPASETQLDDASGVGLAFRG